MDISPLSRISDISDEIHDRSYRSKFYKVYEMNHAEMNSFQMMEDIYEGYSGLQSQRLPKCFYKTVEFHHRQICQDAPLAMLESLFILPPMIFAFSEASNFDVIPRLDFDPNNYSRPWIIISRLAIAYNRDVPKTEYLMTAVRSGSMIVW